MSLVSPVVVSPVTVVGVKQVDVLVIVTGQELCTDERGQKGICLISLWKAEEGDHGLLYSNDADKCSQVVDLRKTDHKLPVTGT